MTLLHARASWPILVFFAAGGFALGVGYFASLRRGVHLSISRHLWSHYVLLALARIAVATLYFAFAVRWGAPALLAAFAGFLLARQLAVRAVRGAA